MRGERRGCGPHALYLARLACQAQGEQRGRPGRGGPGLWVRGGCGMGGEETLSTREVAARLGVNASTVRRRRKRGELVAHEVTTVHGVEWRFPVHLLPPRAEGAGGAQPVRERAVAPVGAPPPSDDLLQQVRRLGALEATAAMQAMRIRELEAEVRALRGAQGVRAPWWRRLFGRGA